MSAPLYSYRNVTHNGVFRAVALSESAIASKLAALHAEYPETVFERVEVEIVTVRRQGYVPGRGRAGNSYLATWNERVLREVRPKKTKR